MNRVRAALGSTVLGLIAFGGVVADARADCGSADPRAIELAKDGDHLRSSDLEGAIAKYVEAHRLSPENAAITRKLSLAYVKSEAWQNLEKLTASDCGKTDAQCIYFHGYALAHLAQRGQATWSDAKTAFEAALAVDPNLADAHIDLGDAALHLDDEKSALDHFTRAIRLRPDNQAAYPMLADLYLRLGYLDLAERVLAAGVARHDSFVLRSLWGYARDQRGDSRGAITQYEAARTACGNCAEPGQPIAFFNLGAAYTTANPPRKQEAVENLQRFWKMICKGAAAQRYADQCMQAQALANRSGFNLQ